MSCQPLRRALWRNMDIELYKGWLKELMGILDGAAFPKGNRAKVSFSLLHLSVEHHQSMILLSEFGKYGSALALLRPQRDTCLRGMWYLRNANEEQLEKFLSDKNPPGIKDLLKGIEQTEPFTQGHISSLMDKVGNLLHDFTHGGLYQAAIRHKGSNISSSIDPSQLNAFLCVSQALALAASHDVILATGDKEREKALISAHTKYFP